MIDLLQKKLYGNSQIEDALKLQINQKFEELRHLKCFTGKAFRKEAHSEIDSR